MKQQRLRGWLCKVISFIYFFDFVDRLLRISYFLVRVLCSSDKTYQSFISELIFCISSYSCFIFFHYLPIFYYFIIITYFFLIAFYNYCPQAKKLSVTVSLRGSTPVVGVVDIAAPIEGIEITASSRILR